MNTPAHLLLGAAVMGRGGGARVTWAALAGALLPDMSLYLLAGVSFYILNIPPSTVFNDLYFSDTWQTIFAIDNSFFIWGALFGVALWRRSDWVIALTGAALLHLVFDLPLHHDDGRAHFWPLTGWIFESPLSYWDRGYGAAWIAPIEAAIAVICAAVLMRRRLGIALNVLTLGLVIAELMVVRNWLFFFIDS